jgi:hypothetical protein
LQEFIGQLEKEPLPVEFEYGVKPTKVKLFPSLKPAMMVFVLNLMYQ